MVVDKIYTVKDLIDFLAYEKRKIDYIYLSEHNENVRKWRELNK